MAKLHEYQGKALLREAKIPTPPGEVASTPEEARGIAERIGGPVVVKGQVWITSRAARGAIAFADVPEQAEAEARRILGLRFDGFRVERVLVEEKIDIEQEFYAGVIVDDRLRAPVLVFSPVGGSGIEEIARENPDRVIRRPVSVRDGLRGWEARDLLRGLDIHGPLQAKLAGVLVRLCALCRRVEARSGEINPLVLTVDGELRAADCRITIDDYAVFRHPELGIEIAREFDRPPTALEKIAYRVEEGDYRGTFYFIQMEETTEQGRGQIGFHGAGGGGSMMSMDALLARGFRIANFCDTSGNPPASKVYRAARIIFSQPGIDGYFASGSGVASQEQYHSARGLAKAFLEEGLPVPAVIRLGGNMEERAIEILEEAAGVLRAPLEAYGKETSADACADRMRTLVDGWTGGEAAPVPPGREGEAREPYAFETQTGRIDFDHALCLECESKACIEGCVPSILELSDGRPVLNIDEERAKKGGCTECLACELECFFRGKRAVRIELPIPGLEEYRAGIGPGR
jgi:succinyl-CoA synthetase beta subunit